MYWNISHVSGLSPTSLGICDVPGWIPTSLDPEVPGSTSSSFPSLFLNAFSKTEIKVHVENSPVMHGFTLFKLETVHT